jgi:AcrR family transcriptional regulator
VPRPANASTDEILSRVLRLIAEHDIPGVSVNMIAEATKVSKSTIYSRWSSKEHLIFDAIGHMAMPDEIPDTGDVADDLKLVLQNLIAFLNDPEVGRVFAAFLNAALRNPDLAGYRRKLTARAIGPFEEVIDRGVRSGQIRLALPMHLAIDILLSPFAYRKIASNRPLKTADVNHIVDFFMRASSVDSADGCNPKTVKAI